MDHITVQILKMCGSHNSSNLENVWITYISVQIWKMYGLHNSTNLENVWIT